MIECKNFIILLVITNVLLQQSLHAVESSKTEIEIINQSPDSLEDVYEFVEVKKPKILIA